MAGPRWGEDIVEAMDDRVGTRPESVVKRRGMLERGSWEVCGCVCWGRRAPLRGGETKPVIGASFRGDCWDRKRRSSMVEVEGRRTRLAHAELAPWAPSR